MIASHAVTDIIISGHDLPSFQCSQHSNITCLYSSFPSSPPKWTKCHFQNPHICLKITFLSSNFIQNDHNLRALKSSHYAGIIPNSKGQKLKPEI